jgi:S-adenosylmethionine:tRNA ribosyltransferase-isomerase
LFGRTFPDYLANMRLEQFSYHLPADLIAQTPAEPRTAARLMVYDRLSDTVVHARIRDLPNLLPPRSVLVANNSKVRRSRLWGIAQGPSSHPRPVELLLLEPLFPNGSRLPSDSTASCTFRCLIGGRRIGPGSLITCYVDSGRSTPIPLQGQVTAREPDRQMTTYQVTFPVKLEEAEALIEQYGTMPLPPYIRTDPADPERYQTTYARHLGSAAAPTAGLHFTPGLIQEMRTAGHAWEEVTLHVGLGTFLPLRHSEITANRLHKEQTEIFPETAARLNAERQDGRPLLAIGTTACRTLESHSRPVPPGPAGKPAIIQAGNQDTDLFIYPGFIFQATSALLTNFHLPHSSLLLLVAAFLGNHPSVSQLQCTEADMVATLHRLYRTAIQERYRFYSFGDAMLIL